MDNARNFNDYFFVFTFRVKAGVRTDPVHRVYRSYTLADAVRRFNYEKPPHAYQIRCVNWFSTRPILDDKGYFTNIPLFSESVDIYNPSVLRSPRASQS